jgi:hypothetical protein
LLTYKCIAAFDFDYIFPYASPVSRHPWLAASFSLPIFCIGILGIFLHLCCNNLPVLGHRVFPLLVFVAWSAVTLPSAV